jgi:archaemetzincin
MKKIMFLLFIVIVFSFKTYTPRTIYIQPLGNVNQKLLNYVKNSVTEFYGYTCIIKPKINLTNDILTASKTRYEASKILNKFNSNQNKIIITEVDIAHRKNSSFPEWGIFGLGLRPGKTCVVSTFRLKKGVTIQQMLVRLKKVSLHEIGHNFGLMHCNKHKNCLMNDAKGTIKQVDKEKIWFCQRCSKIINHN